MLTKVGTLARVEAGQFGINERSIVLDCDVVGIDGVLTAADCCIRLVGCDGSTDTEDEVTGRGVVVDICDVIGTCAAAKEGEDRLCGRKISG